jgi:Na+/proline symporter
LIGGFFLFLSYFGCDQSQVQRFLTAKSVSEGRTSLLMSAFLKIPMQFLILTIGVMVFVFYQFSTPPMIFNAVEANKAQISKPSDYQNLQKQYESVHAAREQAALDFVTINRQGNEAATEAAKQTYLEADAQFNASRKNATEFIKTTNENKSFNDVNYVFPTFIIANMPAGVIGLIIAAIFAAAMSSISAELNSLATATVIDFYRRHFKPEATDTHYVFAGRVATFFWGIFACIVAMYSTSLGSLIEVVNTFGSFFYGSLLGVFVLAIGVRRARARGAFFGLLFGIISVWISSQFLDIAFLWFNVIGCFATVIAGYLISLTVRGENNVIVE